MSIQETLLQKMIQSEKRQTNMEEDLKYIRKNLFGNGEPGLDEQVRLNTRFREDVRKLIWAFVTVFLGQLALVIITLIK